MAERIQVRNVSPLLQAIRNFLLGRKHVPERATLRYTPLVSARDQPPPVLPEGDQHKLSANHYCKRDGRREVTPPTLIVDTTTRKQLTAGAGTDVAPKAKQPVTPGKYWELSGLGLK